MKDVKVKPARAKSRRPASAPAPEATTPTPAPVVEAVAAPKAPVRKAARPTAAKAPVAKTPELPLAPVAAEPAPAPTLVETVVAPIAALDLAAGTPAPDALLRPVVAALETGQESARTLLARSQEHGATLRTAMSESATAASRGLVELNGQVLDFVRAQSDATLGLWRSALSAGSVSEAIRLQTSGARQVYETSATHWKAIAETATRTAEAAMRPMLATRG